MGSAALLHAGFSLYHDLLCFVWCACVQVGSTVAVEVRGKRSAATVVKMPFVPHNYYKPTKA